MTKDQLLAKGLSPELADEIVSSFSASENESPLLALNKALKGSKEVENELFKAEKGDDEPDGDEGKGKKSKESDDDGDEEAYMKKGEDEDEEAEEKAKAMKKARESLDGSEGAVVEMADLAPFLGAMTEFTRSMTKALSSLRAENKTIKAQNAELYDLMHKAASVQAITAEALGQTLSQPVGRRGVTNAPAVMAKAQQPVSDSAKVYQTLAKAMRAGDQKAGFILSAFESCGKRIGALGNPEKAYISELLTKGE